MADKVRVARYPVRPIRGRWPAPLERRASRFFWVDPTLILDQGADDDSYRLAMNAFSMGETIKITQRDRHPEVDDLLIEHVDIQGAHILDVGASDGSTSADLIERLPDFATYTIADLHLYAEVASSRRHTVFLQTDGDPFLVVGRRLLAWPRESRIILNLYKRVIDQALRSDRQPVLLINPRVRRLADRDLRIRFAVHDVFTPWAGEPLDVVKAANLLRLDYFAADQLVDAFGAILRSLREGGHLLVANNLRAPGAPFGGGLFRKRDSRFEVVATAGSGLDVEPQILAASG